MEQQRAHPAADRFCRTISTMNGERLAGGTQYSYRHMALSWCGVAGVVWRSEPMWYAQVFHPGLFLLL